MHPGKGDSMITMLAMFLAVALAVPPAAKVLAVIAVIYGVIQGLKQIPVLTPFLTGWVAIALNVALSTLALFVGPTAIPADQLYTVNTLLTVLSVGLGAAGIHGTVASLTKKNAAPAVAPPAAK